MDFEHEDLIVSSFLKTLGAWSNHVVIGGGYAPIIYKLYFAERERGIDPVGTRDIDSLLPRRIPAVSTKTIYSHLVEAGFEQLFKDHNQPATESYNKEINGIDIEVEFLTDASSRKDPTRNVDISGVVAQPLSYIELSLQTSEKFTTFSGEEGLVVSPAAWVFHKGLTFTKRKAASKSLKDLYGIWYVATQLATTSEKAKAELVILAERNKNWTRKFIRNLSDWLRQASPKDWENLESQDPSGYLRRKQFQKELENMLTGLTNR